jgi:ATP-dependent Clp protease ATP-binding subunit ClpA
VANILAKSVTGMKPITLNMPEYNSEASINRIIGVPAGYMGCDSNQELPFDILETNPYQIILLDEFEKCDRSVQRLFMQVFDQGTMNTNAGKTLDFSKAIIIATTNAGCSTDATPVIGFSHESSKNDISGLEGFFDVELINRFTHKVKFNSINKETYRNIVAELYKTMVADVKSRIRKVHLADELDEAELDRIVEDSYNSKFGARPAESYVRHYIEENA